MSFKRFLHKIRDRKAILINHPKLCQIIQALNYNKIKSGSIPSGCYSSRNHPGYAGNTIFEGIGSSGKKWISVNIIQGESDLYLHTSLPLNGGGLKNLIQDFPCFDCLTKPTTLLKVGSLRLNVSQLVQSIENNIFPYL